MNILEGLFFGSQVPFDEVDVNCPEYYQAGDKVDKIKAKYSNNTLTWNSLWNNSLTHKWSKPSSADFTNFLLVFVLARSL